jgi:hypothetical protein
MWSREKSHQQDESSISGLTAPNGCPRKQSLPYPDLVFLEKPFEMDTLLDLIRQLLEKS